MSIFLIVLFVAVIVGAGIILFSILTFSAGENKNAPANYIEIDNTIKAIDSSVREADNAIEELNKLAKSIFEELEGKYQELLFLYTLIDEKKKSVVEDYRRPEVKTDITIGERAAIHNPKLDSINELKNRGLSVSEIAKSLNMGQGEVKLILEMGKGR